MKLEYFGILTSKTLFVLCLTGCLESPTFNKDSYQVSPASRDAEGAMNKPIDGYSGPASPSQNPTFLPPQELSTQQPSASSPQVAAAPDTFSVTINSMRVINDKNGTALKGDVVLMLLQVKNSGSKAGKVKITPYLSTNSFSDFENVKLQTREFEIYGLEDRFLTLELPNFFQDANGSKKEYALNSGLYNVDFDFEGDGIAKKRITNLQGNTFNIGKSKKVFTAVLWHQSYFDKVKYTGGVKKWMQETYSRKGEINDGGRTVKASAGGFDEMMNIETVFKTFEGFRLDRSKDSSATGILYQTEDWAKNQLGLQGRWQSTDCESLTHTDNHGFDMLIGLSNDGFGGLAWLCGNSQASGVFDADSSIGRSQMVLIHETGHNYGAPHCDPIQGFIMCSGEKHSKYTSEGTFVWHTNSFNDMKKKDTSAAAGLSLTSIPNQPELVVCDHQ